MTNTPIDRESVERLAKHLAHEVPEPGRPYKSDATVLVNPQGKDAADTLLALRAALDAAEAENKRLRDGLVELRDDPILHRKTAYMRRRAAVILKENPDG